MTFWDRAAKRFDTPPPTPEEDEAVAGALRWLQPDDRVLELGCAAGATAEALAQRVASWHGIDVSKEMIRRARARGIQNATFQQAAADEIDGAYTAVVAFNVLHFTDLDDTIDRIAGVLPHGGLLMAQTPCLGDLPRLAQAGLPALAFVLRVPGLRRLSFGQLNESVERHFEVVEMRSEPAAKTWLVARKRHA